MRLVRDHHAQRADQLHKMRHRVEDRVAHSLVRVAHVVIQAAHQLAGARVGEEAQRHALQVVVEVQAQVVRQPLADIRIQLAPSDTERAAN